MRKPQVEAGADPNLALKVFMMAAGLNAKQLAEKIGMKHSTLTRKLAGQHEFKISEAKAIGKALNLSIEELSVIFLD